MNLYNFDLYIHSNRKNKIPALTSYWSFKKHNNGLEIYIENLENLPLLMECNGKNFIRGGRNCMLNTNSSQSFFFVRFICCELAKKKNSKKWILIIDPDIFCLKSIEKLNEYIIEAEDKDKHIICNKNLSSFMLINTDKINWCEKTIIHNIFNLKENVDNYMQLKRYNNVIFNIPEEFNSYDKLNSKTICLHTSNTSSQPWKTGIKYFPSDLHNRIPNKDEKKDLTFEKHKSEEIEKKTIGIFKEAFHNKYFNSEDLKEEIHRENIRPDIFKIFANF